MPLRDYLRNARRFASVVKQRPSRTAAGLAIPVFVLNLERAKHRRHYVVSHLHSFGIEPRIVTAVDGRALDLAELERQGIYNDQAAREAFRISLSPAMIGCALSHLNAYKMVVAEKIDVALIAEDDVLFHADLLAQLTVLLETLPPDASIVHLLSVCKDHERVNDHIVRFTMVPTMPVGATAYLITRQGAEKMLDNAFPIRYPADSYIGRSPRWGVAVYGAEPSVAEINNVFPSDIIPVKGFRSRAVRAVRETVLKLLD